LKPKRSLAPGRIRRPGGGRQKSVDQDPTRLTDLEGLVEPTASGDPRAPLRWISRSVRQLAASLHHRGHPVSRHLVAALLAAAGYSLPAKRTTREGPAHPDREAQFRYLNQHVRRFQGASQPIISVDPKQKELVGDFTNAGRPWRPPGPPPPGRGHDFLIPAHGNAIPDGVYDLTRTAGWVSVGVDHDTATFAVRPIGRWWRKLGRPRYRRARSVLITADAGGSNGPRVRLWKWEWPRLANRAHLASTVCHRPPGTSQWNKIEHRLFSYISPNWRGQPLVSLAVIVNLIGSPRTATGLMRCELDRGAYPEGQDVTDAQMATL
jgi:hypothetical protein